MKKLISLLLALAMVFSLSITVAAVDGNNGDGSNPMTEFTIKVNYDLLNSGTVAPDETFKFTVEANSFENCGLKKDGSAVTLDDVPEIDDISVAFGADNAENGNADQDATSYGKLKITLPSPGDFQAVGVYKYLIHPVTPSNDSTTTNKDTAGVAYHTGDILLVVTVQHGADGLFTYASVHTEAGFGGNQANQTKKDTITETYSAGNLQLKKFVSGNLGDTTAPFTVKVTLTGDTAKYTYPASFAVSQNGGIASNPTTIALNTATEFTIKHNGTIQIDNIPYGVTVSVDEPHVDGYDTERYHVENLNADGQYVGQSYTNEQFKDATTDIAITENDGVIKAPTKVVGIYNNKGVPVDTGVILDSAPYILLLAVAVIGLAVVIIKKRQAREY